MRSAAALLLASLLATAPAKAQEQGSVPVVIDGGAVDLTTLTYKPRGEGPFPTLIFHHGSGSFRDPKAVAQWFVARGWAVIAPARRGRAAQRARTRSGSSVVKPPPVRAPIGPCATSRP